MENKTEYEELKSYLEDRDLYEHGMDFEDMKRIKQAILESIDDSGLDFDLETALRESECEFLETELQNSTMISIPVNNSKSVESGYTSEHLRSISPPSSPDNPQTFTVVAQVHYDENYNEKVVKDNANLEMVVDNEIVDKTDDDF